MIRRSQDNTSELKQIFHDLLGATRSAEIKNILRTLVEEYNGTWRLVGDRANYPTVHMASSPVASAVERITNAIDAQLEAVALYSPEIVESCGSPRKLVERRYKVKDGYLTSLGHAQARKEQLVKETNINIIVRDGDTESTPTIDVIDKGIGVAVEEFPETLLSLNRENKISKWYLMGRFGQGGSTTYRWSEYTVMISRRRHINRLNDDIAFTVVKYREARAGEKDGQYVYLVKDRDRLPFSISADSVDFEAGTLVRHVDYDLGKKYFLDIYGLMETHLFDPVLPFWLREERSWETNRGQGRRIFGSRDRLARTSSVEEKDEFVASLDHEHLGDVIIRFWVFSIGTQTKEKATFIDPGQPIVVTYLGQTHAKLPRRILAKDCRLPYLYKDLAVQIDCDNITDKGRRTIFTSTREVITEEGRRLLRDSLVNTLSDELSDLDQKRQMDFLTEGVTKAKEELRRKLVEMINRIKPGTFKMPSGDIGTTGYKRKKRRRRRRTSKVPLETKDFPTYIRIANKQDPLKFSEAWIGTWIEVESDAPDDFLSSFDAALELSEVTRRFCQIVVKHKDFRGGRLYLKAGLFGELDVGTRFPFSVRLRFPPRNGVKEFNDTREAIVVEPPPKGDDKKLPLDAPNIYPVNTGDSFWEENEWTEDNVAEVKEGNSIDIYVSLGNKWLTGALTRAKYTLPQKEFMKSKYLLNMAFYAYLQNKGLDTLTENGAVGDDLQSAQNIPERLLEKIRQESLEWGARALLTAMTSEQAFSTNEAQAFEFDID